MVIAIDGPAGAGKSTVARAVPDALGFTYLDSGAMYRCVALAAIQRGADLDSAEEIGELARSLRIDLHGGGVAVDGREGEGGAAGRGKMAEATRAAAGGRNCGTGVRPGAPLRVSPPPRGEERARRRA